MTAPDFERIEKDGVVFYACRVLGAITGLRHGFSARPGSLNLSPRPWDTLQRVAENRCRLLRAVGLDGAELETLAQIHSDRVVVALPAFMAGRTKPREGDALVARGAGVAIAVQVADCFPVLIADPCCGAIAAVHAGWRGTLGRILPRAVARMRRVFGCDPRELVAAIGPGIRSCCCEVGPEVAKPFAQAFGSRALSEGSRAGKQMLDLAQTLKMQAEEAGLTSGNLFDLGACTRCRPDEFYSHRADGAAAGRMMGLVGFR